MSHGSIFLILDGFFLLYVLAVNSSYLILNLLSAYETVRRMLQLPTDTKKLLGSGKNESIQPGVSVLVPAYNEREIICSTVKSLLRVDYSAYEIIVVNDGSNDGTLEKLREEFDFVPFPGVYRERIETHPVREVYRSREHSRLKMLHKDNGGKHDALNAGMNVSTFPHVCVIDADSVLEPDSLAWNSDLLFDRSGGFAGWLSFPYMTIFEGFECMIEIAGYVYMTLGYGLGVVPLEIMLLYFWVAIGLGSLHSTVSVLLEEIYFRQLSGLRDVLIPFVFSILENLGYRQWISFLRLGGLVRWLRGSRWEPEPGSP